MHVAAVVKRKGNTIVTVDAGDSATTVAQILARHRIGAVLVTDETGHPAGILSERDIVRHVAAHGGAALDRPAAELMTRDIVVCRPTDTVSAVMALMTERRIRHVPVMDGDHLAGMISIGDVVKARLDDMELEVDSMRGYVAGLG